MPAALPSSHAAWSVVETARDTTHRLTPVPAPRPAAGDTNLLQLEPGKKFQEMIGFGGALTESSAWVLAQLPAEQRLEVIRRYYDPQHGIGYTMARTHLNSCDFSLSLWSLAPTPGDYDLHSFTLEPMRAWLMPLLHDARRVAGGDARFKLLVSPWSPPHWMKTNFRMDDGGSLRREYAPAWAQMFVKFAQHMEREEQFPVWGFTIQNEPEAHQVWESCLYTPEQERDFIKHHLGPALQQAGLLDRIKLIGWDHNRDRLEARAAALLGDPDCAKYLWGLGIHWYVSNDFAASSRVQAQFPDKPILFTEGCVESGTLIGRWENGERYATQMIGDFKHGVAAYMDWNIVLDQRGGPNHVGNFCDAPVIVNTATKQVSYGASFHYIAHFSKFVQPGAHRIASGEVEGLDSVAFLNPDGSLVAVVMNRTDQPASFTLAAADGRLACTIPARAIQTYLRQP